MDYYKILGVDKNATQEDIKKAYRKLAHMYHPDKGGDAKKFQKINEAYHVLSNKEKRSQYDRFGSTFEQEGGSGFGNFWQQTRDGFDFNNIGDIFEEFFGGGVREERTEDIRRGDDIELELELVLSDVLVKTEKKFIISRFNKCSRCQGTGAEPGTKLKECQTCRGTGMVQEMRRTFFGTITHQSICPNCRGEGYIPEKPCNVCKGEGRIKEESEISLEIPAGVDNGQILKFKGEGQAGRKQGKSGDLYVRISIKPHSVFKRKGDDLYTKQKIKYSTAVLGGILEFASLQKGKKTVLKIPKHTKSSEVFKIRNKGIPRFAGFGRGDLFVEVKVETPEVLTKEQKNLIKRLQSKGL
jgi:molecular chaperone DnaJ